MKAVASEENQIADMHAVQVEPEKVWTEFVRQVQLWGRLDDPPINFLGSVSKHKECFDKAVAITATPEPTTESAVIDFIREQQLDPETNAPLHKNLDELYKPAAAQDADQSEFRENATSHSAPTAAHAAQSCLRIIRDIRRQRDDCYDALVAIMKEMRSNFADPMEPFSHDFHWEQLAIAADAAINAVPDYNTRLDRIFAVCEEQPIESAETQVTEPARTGVAEAARTPAPAADLTLPPDAESFWTERKEDDGEEYAVWLVDYLKLRQAAERLQAQMKERKLENEHTRAVLKACSAEEFRLRTRVAELEAQLAESKRRK